MDAAASLVPRRRGFALPSGSFLDTPASSAALATMKKRGSNMDSPAVPFGWPAERDSTYPEEPTRVRF